MLQINELHLTNFINITEADFVFDNNMNFIYGQPASGKSAIFEAMLVTLSTYKRSSTYGEYVRQGQDDAKIHLKATILGKNAIFDTIINRVKGAVCQRRLEYDGEIFEDSAVEEWLKARSIDYYAKLTFAMQNEENIVNITSAERLAYIQKLFNFNFKSKKDKLQALKKEVEDSIINLNSKIAGNNSTIEHLSIEKETEQRRLDDKTRKDYEEKITAQTNLIKENQIIIDNANKIKEEINKIDLQIMDCDSKISQEEQINNNEKEKENDIKTLQDEIVLAKNKITELSNLINDLQGIVNEKYTEKTEIAEKLNEHTTKRIEIESKIKEINNKIDLVKKGICPQCGQPTKNLDNNLQEQLDKLNAEYEEEQKVFADLCLNKKEIEATYAIVNNTFNTNNIDLAGERSSLEMKKARLESLQKREPAKHICNIDEVAKQKNELLVLKEAKKKELEEYKITKSVSELLDEIEPLKQAINDDNIIIEKNALIIKTNSENKAKCADLTIENKKLLEDVVALNNNITTIKEAYEIINKTLPKYISKAICDRLENKINNFIHKIFPKFQVKLEATEKGCDLLYTKDKTVVDEKRNKFLKATMSSGLERSLLSLAFKVALAESYNLDLFVGDEIDQSSDQKDATTLMDILINSKNFKQLFIISHKQEVLEHITENYKGNTYQVSNGNFTKTNF